jgi:hypothetical protein
MTRKIGEKLISKMSNLKALAKRLFSDYDPKEKEVNVERIKLHRLLSFTSGETRMQLEEALGTCERNKEKPEWDELLEGVLLSEERYGMAKEELKFQNVSENSVFCFNVDTRKGYVPEPLVNTGLGISCTGKRKNMEEKFDTTRPPPNSRANNSRENTSGSFVGWRQDKKDHSKEISIDEKEKAESLEENDNKQTNLELTETEFYKTVCDELSAIFNTNDETAINVSRSDETPIESTPLPSTSDGKTTRAGRTVRPTKYSMRQKKSTGREKTYDSLRSCCDWLDCRIKVKFHRLILHGTRMVEMVLNFKKIFV